MLFTKFISKPVLSHIYFSKGVEGVPQVFFHSMYFYLSTEHEHICHLCSTLLPLFPPPPPADWSSLTQTGWKTKETLLKEFKVAVSADCRGVAAGRRLEVVKRRQIPFHAALGAVCASCAYCSSSAVDSRRSGTRTPTLPCREGSRHMCRRWCAALDRLLFDWHAGGFVHTCWGSSTPRSDVVPRRHKFRRKKKLTCVCIHKVWSQASHTN